MAGDKVDLLNLRRWRIVTRHIRRLPRTLSFNLGHRNAHGGVFKMPKAYVIAEIDVHDLDAYKSYIAQAPISVADYGGRYLVRAGAVEVLEGDAPLPRVVMLEFPSMAQAKAWYASADYQKVLPIRLGASHGHAFIVEGHDG
jgi:uncharacterized protein (DUF1330 family)